MILAAGEGKRFSASGGIGYKQLVPVSGTPLIKRIVQQIYETKLFNKVVIVLGQNEECNMAIIDELHDFKVEYVTNEFSRIDNNLLSFQVATKNLHSAIVLIEADCIFDTEDLIGMAVDLREDEIRWAEIGSVDAYDQGGLIELDEKGNCIAISVLVATDFAKFKSEGRLGKKMFGLTAFGKRSLERYRELIDEIDVTYGKYFHCVASDWPNEFQFSTYHVNDNCISFNTVTELYT